MKLLIITPFKNEEATIEQTIASILMQKTKPEAWILVDDNSTDTSPTIVKQYQAEIDYIH